MRVITGSQRGRRLFTLEGNDVRPTTDKVKESIFNIIQFDIEGRSVLDLFAGSGQMGLEALSRGAVKATFIDSSREAMEIVKQNARATGFEDSCHYLVSDWRNYIRKASGREQFDLVFVDPPYAMECCAEAANYLAEKELIIPGAIVVLESGEEEILPEDERLRGFEVIKSTHYGKKTILKLKLSNMQLIPKVIFPCLALGISSFVMVSTESILSISFTSSLAKFGGDVAVGAMTVLTSINQLMTMPLSGVCQGGQPLISYNYGAKKYDRVKEAFFCQFFTCVAYTVVFWLVLMLFPNVFAGIFTSDVALVDYTAWAIKIFLALGFSVGFQISCQQAFMALGQAKISLFMALLRKVFLLIPLIFILPNFFENKAFAVFLAEPVSDIIAAAVTTFMFFRFFIRMLKEGKAAQQ